MFYSPSCLDPHGNKSHHNAIKNYSRINKKAARVSLAVRTGSWMLRAFQVPNELVTTRPKWMGRALRSASVNSFCLISNRRVSLSWIMHHITASASRKFQRRQLKRPTLSWLTQKNITFSQDQMKAELVGLSQSHSVRVCVWVCSTCCKSREPATSSFGLIVQSGYKEAILRMNKTFIERILPTAVIVGDGWVGT